MITDERILEIFQTTGVLQEGHFLLASGKHSQKYMQCAKIFQYANYSEELCRELSKMFDNVEIVIGPAIGAIQMSYEVSRHLGVKNLFAERENGVMALRRGFTIEKGQRVLVVEDVVTTGGSVKEVIELVKAVGGEVIGVGSLVDRSKGKADFGVPFKALISVDVESFEADECPLCKKGMEIQKPGSKRK